MKQRPKISRQTAASLVADRMRTDILSGALRAGQRLVIPALVEEHGVSHIPIREAIRALEGESLVELRPGYGAIVVALDPEELSALFHLRRLLERDFLHEAFDAYTQTYLKDLEDRLAALDLIDPRRENEDWWQARRAFLWAFIEPGASVWGRGLLRIVWQSIERYQRQFGLKIYPPKQVSKRHRDLVVAAKTGQAALMDAWFLELDRSEKAIEDGYKKSQRVSLGQRQK